jgi:uncharacterized protein (TIGR00255 family)
MRKVEGKRLADLFAAHLNEIERLCTAAAASAGAQPLAIRQKVEKQFAELLQGLNPLNEDRLAQEAAVLAGKADVREELDRLNAHIAAARDLIARGGAVGTQTRLPLPGIQPRGQHALLQERRYRPHQASGST